VLTILNKALLGFEAGDELLFFFDLILGLLDEVGGGTFDVVRVGHAEVQIVELAADGEDALGESIFVLFDDFFGDIEVKLVIR
jgi:hypothetical protein